MATHIMIDGIAGSGKTTILRAYTDTLLQSGKRIFSLETFEKSEHRLPTFSEVSGYDLLWLAEPTKSWVGACIRAELFRTDIPYDPKILAHAFALDRSVLYQRLVLPAKQAGMPILHERGVFSSIAYQGMMPGGYTRDEIAALPGNRDVLQHLPDVFVVLDPGSVACGLERIHKRDDASRGVVGESTLLSHARDWFVNSAPDFFAQTSCQYRILSTSEEKERATAQGISLLSSLFSSSL